MMNWKTPGREKAWALGISLVSLLLCTSGAIAQCSGGTMTEKQLVSQARKSGKPAYVTYTITDAPDCPTCPRLVSEANNATNPMIRRYIGKRFVVGMVAYKSRGELYKALGANAPRYVVIDPSGGRLHSGSLRKIEGNQELKAWAKGMNKKATEWPAMPYATVRSLRKSVTQAREEMKNNEYALASSLVKTTRRVWYPKEFVEECATFQKEIAGHGTRLLAEAAAMTEENKKLDAAMKYVFINSQFLQTTKVGAESRKLLGELMREDDAIKKQVPILQRKQRAETLLAQAVTLETQERTKRAIAAYKGIAKKYGDLDAGKTAQAAVDRLAQASSKKPVASKKATPPATPAQRAARMMRLATTYREQGMKDKAKDTLDQLIAKYPDTEAATEARKLKETW